MKDAFGTALYQAGSNKPLTLASPEELIGKIIISVQYKLQSTYVTSPCVI